MGFRRDEFQPHRGYDEVELLKHESERISGQVKASIVKNMPTLIAEQLPDACDVACSLWGVIVPAVLEEIEQYVSSLPGMEEMNAPVWNFVDAGASIFQGGVQLADQHTHRPLVTKGKGVVNITSGITLASITGVSMTLGAAAGAALASQALVGAIGVAFVLSCDDVTRSSRRLADPVYWMNDTIKQMNKLETYTIPQAETKLEQHKARFASARQNRYGEKYNKKERVMLWLIRRKEQRLEKLKKFRDKLESDIKDRVNGNPQCNKYYEKHIAQGVDALSQRVITIFNGDLSPNLNIARGKKTEKKIREEGLEDFRKASQNSILIGCLFAGTLLLCIPGCQLPATILLGGFTAWYLTKYAYTAGKSIPKVAKSIGAFFSKKQSVDEVEAGIGNSFQFEKKPRRDR